MSDATGSIDDAPIVPDGTDDNLIVIDPASIGRGPGSGDSGSGTGRRGRGRPRGSTNKTSGDNSATLKGIEIDAILVSIHALLSVKLGQHWALDGDESKQLEKAIKNAMRHQDMKITQKQLDYAMLAYVVAQIYGSRIVTSVMMARMKQPEQRPDNVSPFRQGA